MKKIASVCIVVSALWLSATLVVDGFVVLPGQNDIGRTTASVTRTTELYGRRVMKRGGLGSIDNDGSSAATKTGPRRSTKQQRKTGSSRKKKSSSGSGNGNNKIKPAAAGGASSEMSLDLAKFLEQSSGDEDDNNEAVGGGRNKKTRTSAKSDRRRKQSAKKVIDDARNAKVEVVVDELEEVLGERTGNVRDILAVVEKLLKIPSDNINTDVRRLLSVKSRSDYRLAWVGSDDALCHIGTGLHKVPLARMQEVFMNCLGRNRIEILEVISLIGPFPNVKNTLQGTTTISSGNEVQIVMEKMIDGTGKQIDAGTEDNIRRVNLEVAFFDERAIVVVMPDADNEDAKPLDDSGKRVLLFVREEDLEERLESWRVNEIDLD
eukprot:CAMPEP_0197191510 /NCGR_PEP_ID=MMETSP1423-20130617/23530_1 /TAXON_ID=476441 /ORGANISM="Pseudo-nitzschia heimii, Strain UNC1101" /LENGTH=377 /DNA_ID=CAMNT_0042644169 /DNA_START=123 /DNA_END=1256 /DNA_ORIENTATION=+